MAGVSILMLGDLELQKKLQALPDKLEKQIVKKAIRKAMKPILERARQLAPKDTGRMAATLRIVTLRSRQRGKFGMQVVSGTKPDLGIAAGSKWYYPAHVELGTRKMPARSYLRAAMDSLRESTLEKIKAEIGAGIERAAKAR